MVAEKTTAKGRKKQTKSKQKKYKPRGIERLYHKKEFVTMTFTENFAVSTGVNQGFYGVMNEYRMNSIAQPRNGSNFRPNGYDQIKNIYGQYKVYACKYRVKFFNPQIAGIYGGVRAIRDGGTNNLELTSLTSAPMQMNTKSNTIPVTGDQSLMYEGYWPIHQVEGLTHLEHKADLDNYNAVIVANPNKMPRLQIAVANSANTTNYAVNYSVELTFYVKLYDRTGFDPSLIS